MRHERGRVDDGVEVVPAAVLARIAELEAHVARLTAQLRNLADHDPLTDLLNLEAFAEAVEDQVALDVRYGHRTSLVIVDIEGLDRVLQTDGPAAVDDCLVTAAERIRARLRETDRAARLDATRLAVLLPHTDDAGGETVAAALAFAVAGPPPAGLREAVEARVRVIALHSTDEVAAALGLGGETAPDADVLTSERSELAPPA